MTKLKWSLLVVGVLALVAFGVLSYFMGGPAGAYGFLRFALPHWHQGELEVGQPAPDAELVALDGVSTLRLHEKIGQKPLVLIFGSYT